MQYLQALVTDINSQSSSKLSISVLLLAYTLAPEAQFPTQLKQAASVLSYLLNEGGRSPSNIMVGGDSAGGGLTLSLLSHLRHPHLDVPRITLSAPLRGALLYSPWVSFATNHESYIKNAFKDVLVPDVLRKWSSMYLGTSFSENDPGAVTGGNNYNEPLLANASWWEGMHDVVRDVWMYGGEDEVFIDSIRAFGEKFQEGWKAGGGAEEKVVIEYVENNAHVGPIMDFIFQGEKKTELRLAQEEWLKERLS
jgi:acetyl esterase/lipase